MGGNDQNTLDTGIEMERIFFKIHLSYMVSFEVTDNNTNGCQQHAADLEKAPILLYFNRTSSILHSSKHFLESA